MADIYFWRQVFVLSTGLLTSLTIGFMLAFPSVLTPAITSPNSTDIRTTRDHASWMTATIGFGGLAGSFILPPVLQVTGRKLCHCAICMCLFVGFLILAFANNIAALYAGRFIQGISFGAMYINSFIISEYVHPGRRGYFIILKKVGGSIGVLLCHSMSIFWTWRQIAIFAAAPSLLAIIMTFFWPESPSYLALKGKFAACQKSFEWLNGYSEESQKHLTALIETQREKLLKNMRKQDRFMELMKTFVKKDFRKPSIIITVLTLSVDFCGRYYYMAFIIEIMSELMDSKTSGIYFTLGADFLTVIAISSSSVVIRYAKRRTIMFISGILAVLLMLLIALVAYLKTMYMFSPFVLWLTAMMVVFQSFTVNIGLIPAAFAVIGEIFPLEHKGLGSFISCLAFTSLYAVVLKSTPVLMEYTKLYGTYGIFGILLAICLCILYRTVPETKDKTLQQIEDELNNIPDRETTVINREKHMFCELK